jgi:chromate reductase
MKVAIISGSSRPKNNSIKVSLGLKMLLEEMGNEVIIVDMRESDTPIIGKVDKRKGSDLSGFEQGMIDTLSTSEMVFLVAPEYNWGVSPVLKNFLDQFGSSYYSQIWENKVFALAGVSDGGGGKMSANLVLISLSKILSFASESSIVSPKIFWSRETPENIDESGKFLSADYKKAIQGFIDHAVNIRNKLSS